MQPLVLVVEDDAALRSVLTRGLGEEGFRCEAVATGAQMLDRVGDVQRPEGGTPARQRVDDAAHPAPQNAPLIWSLRIPACEGQVRKTRQTRQMRQDRSGQCSVVAMHGRD